MTALRMLTSTQQPGPRPTTAEEGVLIMPVSLMDGEPVREKTIRLPKNRPSGRFTRRAMYKYELAGWYRVSRNHFTDKYLNNPVVLRQLKKKGYTPDTRLLSLAMVNIICNFHDEPGPNGPK